MEHDFDRRGYDSRVADVLRRKKRLGQFFTGTRLAGLLARVAVADQVTSAMDPMAGDGDMLEAVARLAPEAGLFGIEIDPVPAEAARRRLGTRARIGTGNAFSWETVARFSPLAFDLVITNPPYVRYQSLSAEAEDSLPGAEAIRSGLADIVMRLPSLSEGDREILLSLSRAYSGLSDLAIPSWILCATLVKPGGTLAMVAPDSWLTRDYADCIHYLLMKLFRLRCVIENEGRDWFEDALVKTTLLVAQRLASARDLSSRSGDDCYVQVVLHRNAGDDRSPAGGLFPHQEDADRALHDAIERALAGDVPSMEGARFSRRRLTAKLQDLLSSAGSSRWLHALEPRIAEMPHRAAAGNVKVPQPLLEVLSAEAVSRLQSLSDIGVSVGQGLRTGANLFFYCDLVEVKQNSSLVKSGIAPNEAIEVPNGVLLPALRRQAELKNGFTVDAARLPGHVLILDSFSPPGQCQSEGARQPMPDGLRRLVLLAETTKAGTGRMRKPLPEMSAVRTNVRGPNKKNGSLARYWFMLPPLVSRHRPDLFVARVNHQHPRTMLNPGRRAVIDANFSTMWTGPADSDRQAMAVLALMNSSWCLAALELLGTVMGGGALKVEATHLRRMPIPSISPRDWKQLEDLGRVLAGGQASKEVRERIDWVVARSMVEPHEVDALLHSLRQINASCLEARSGS